MSGTNIPYGSPLAVKLQSAGLFAANMQRNTTIGRLTGKFPQQAEAESTIRKQSSRFLKRSYRASASASPWAAPSCASPRCFCSTSP